MNYNYFWSLNSKNHCVSVGMREYNLIKYFSLFSVNICSISLILLLVINDFDFDTLRVFFTCKEEFGGDVSLKKFQID